MASHHSAYARGCICIFSRQVMLHALRDEQLPLVLRTALDDAALPVQAAAAHALAALVVPPGARSPAFSLASLREWHLRFPRIALVCCSAHDSLPTSLLPSGSEEEWEALDAVLGDADAVLPVWPQCRSGAGAEWEPVALFAGVEGGEDGAGAGAREEEAVGLPSCTPRDQQRVLLRCALASFSAFINPRAHPLPNRFFLQADPLGALLRMDLLPRLRYLLVRWKRKKLQTGPTSQREAMAWLPAAYRAPHPFK